MAGFLNPLQLEYLDGHLWKVLASFEYAVGSENSPVKVIIPAGFMTDFASVPKGLWSILPPTGAYGKAAVIHDYLYKYPWVYIEGADVNTKILNRGEVDAIFNEAMGVLEVGSFKRKIMYAGVRAGGWHKWAEYRNEDKSAADKHSGS